MRGTLQSGCLLLSFALSASGAIFYVAPGGGHVPPFDAWTNAAHDIQSAVDAATNGDVVIVSNGLYNTGGRPAAGTALTNRVTVEKVLTIQSVNGPFVTTIAGQYDPLVTNGPAAVRGVWLTTNASLSGFLVISGATATTGSPDAFGGGVHCADATAWLTNCILRDNRAAVVGGVRNGTLRGCVLTGNKAWFAGGAINAALINCTILGNEALTNSPSAAGGVTFGGMTNCICWGNTAPNPSNANYRLAGASYSCTWPLPASGTGNITNDPFFRNYHLLDLLPGSPCVDSGTNQAWMVGAVDLYGQARVVGTQVDMGAAEYYPAGQTGALTISVSAEYGVTGPGYPTRYSASISGLVQSWSWTCDDGYGETNVLAIEHGFSAIGVHEVVVTATNMDTVAAATVTVQIVDAFLYVAPSGSDASSGSSWAEAKATIQSAVDASPPAGTVLVSNGVYESGGRAIGGGPTNRVVLDRWVSLRSVNGPLVTTIRGFQGAIETGDFTAVRCAYLAPGASLVGFTLTNGSTWWTGDQVRAQSGGGVWCESPEAIVTECVITGNRAAWNGGGAYGGTIRNSLVVGNDASQSGGGAASARLSSCSVVGNRATREAGGVLLTTNLNTLIYFNGAPSNANYRGGGFDYCCTDPLPAGMGNLTNHPQVLSVQRPVLLAASPCRDAGLAEPWMAGASDWEGGPRLVGTVDIGADEFDAGSLTGAITVAIQAQAAAWSRWMPVTFEAVVEGRVMGFEWSFGDGVQATNVFSFTKSYAATGTYVVSLIASNATTVATTSVQIAIGPELAELMWAGPSVGWAQATPSNWFNLATGASNQPYFDGNTVLFGDRPGAATNITISGGTVSPGWVTVCNHTSISYGLNVTLSGTGGLTKAGGGSVALEQPSNYAGPTHINGGVLQLYCPAGFTRSLGSAAVPTYIHPGGALDFPRSSYQSGGRAVVSEPLVIAGDGPSGGGAVVNNFSNDNVHLHAVLGYQPVSLAGDAAVGGVSRWDIIGADIALNGWSLTKTGSNVVYNWSRIVGPGSLVVTQGVFGFAEVGGIGTGAGLFSGATLHVRSPGRVWLWRNDTAFPLVTVDGGSVGLQDNDVTLDSHQRGPYVVSNSAYFAGSGTFALWLHGEVSGPGRVVKIGGGAVVLEGTNTYTGGTEVREGTLRGSTDGLIGLITNLSVVEFSQALTGAFAGVITSTGAVRVTGSGRVIIPSDQPYTGHTAISSGVLQVDGSLAGGAVTVGPAGVLAGTGTIGGPVSCAGTVTPGASVGTLHLAADFASTTSGVLRIEVGAAGHDVLDVGGTADLAGELHGETVDGFDPAPGSAFVVLRAAAVTGTFARVTGTPHPGTGWQVVYSPTSVTMVVTGTPVYGFDAYVYAITNEAQRGYLDDPEGDGYLNLLEYGTMGSATGADATAQLRALLSTNIEPWVSFLARPGATDISYFVECAWAPDAADWEIILSNRTGTGWSGPSPFALFPGTNANEVRVGDPSLPTGTLFRLRITRP